MTIGNNDLTRRTAQMAAAKEIKASSHYGYVTQGITLKGSAFAANELVVEGTCLAREKTTGKFVKYTEPTPGTFNPALDYPVILDESIQFRTDDNGDNPDVTAGQVIVHGAVYAGMLAGVTDAFKAKTPMIRYE